MKRIIVVGGGAAGFFAAITCAQTNPGADVTILEKSGKLLSKVLISGGGRCNVTHACYDAKLLVKNYPRGERELIGPFTRFNPTHTIEWFTERGIELKTEADGRMFPTTDSSETIAGCLRTEAGRLGIKIMLHTGVANLKKELSGWAITTTKETTLFADSVIITTGSSSQMWDLLRRLGHQIIPPVPSLFTFNISDERIKNLPGLAVTKGAAKVIGSTLLASGPILITHWGLSGPAILKLSAWGARELSATNYRFELEINWTGLEKRTTLAEMFAQYKNAHPKQLVENNALFNIPARLWKTLVNCHGLNYADLSKQKTEQIIGNLYACRFQVHGKSTFKDEFVTAGGVNLKEVDFKTMQSRLFEGLYFAGEVLDIDAITGGFNFQAAWTTGYIAGISA